MTNNKIDIIPAIDIIDGKCVRLTQGDFDKKIIYNSNPLDVAKEFENIGITRLHLVDLDGAKSGSTKNLFVLENIAKNTSLKIDFGGGLKTEQNINDVLNAGAKWAVIGSLAIKEKETWEKIILKFGANKFILGADVKNKKIAINGWLKNTDILLVDFIKQNIKLGITNIFITDIEKDGLLKGPSIELYNEICKLFPKINIIASGGVHNIKDIEKLILIKCNGVIIGKALYEKKILLTDIKKYL